MTFHDLETGEVRPHRKMHPLCTTVLCLLIFTPTIYFTVTAYLECVDYVNHLRCAEIMRDYLDAEQVANDHGTHIPLPLQYAVRECLKLKEQQ